MKAPTDPIEFTKSMKKGTHALLLYEDENKAKKIRLEFIKAGLKQNQVCIYLTTRNDEKLFEKSLEELGIDVEKYKTKNKFKIFQIPNPFTHNGGFANSINKVWKEIADTFHSPIRIACNIVGDISKLSTDQMENLLTTETCVNQEFTKSEDYLLCTYNIGKTDSEASSDFLKATKEHNATIFAPASSAGMGLYL